MCSDLTCQSVSIPQIHTQKVLVFQSRYAPLRIVWSQETGNRRQATDNEQNGDHHTHIRSSRRRSALTSSSSASSTSIPFNPATRRRCYTTPRCPVNAKRLRGRGCEGPTSSRLVSTVSCNRDDRSPQMASHTTDDPNSNPDPFRPQHHVHRPSDPLPALVGSPDAGRTPDSVAFASAVPPPPSALVTSPAAPAGPNGVVPSSIQKLAHANEQTWLLIGTCRHRRAGLEKPKLCG